MSSGIVILGDEPLPAEVVAAAEACDEVFVVARAITHRGRWVLDEDDAVLCAQARLDALRRHLRARGVAVRGFVDDEDVASARRDARVMCPAGRFLS